MSKEELYKILKNNLDTISCREVITYIEELQEENKEYEKTIVAQDLILKAQENIIHKLLQKIDKAIEYIEKHKEPLHHSFDEPDCDYWIATNPDVLLNILRGEDNDS